MPVILATQEAEIRRIAVQRQPGQIVLKTLSPKTHPEKRVGGVAQGIDPELKPQYHKKKKNCNLLNSYLFSLLAGKDHKSRVDLEWLQVPAGAGR
jgi:hypothetical protein